MRDDFSLTIKDLLAKRVGYKCSNPNCRKPTIGPRIEKNKVVNIGVAAHITAASEGGPRFNSLLTSNERKQIDNGIWLCQNCAKLIDNDANKYTIELISKWKQISELSASLELEKKTEMSQNLQVDNSPGSINTINQIGNNIIQPIVDIPKPVISLISIETENKLTEDQPWRCLKISKVYKTLVSIHIDSRSAINQIDISMRHESLYCIIPKSNQIITYDSMRNRESNKFIFVRLINPQNGIYQLAVYHDQQILNIGQYIEFHWNSIIWRLE